MEHPRPEDEATAARFSVHDKARKLVSSQVANEVANLTQDSLGYRTRFQTFGGTLERDEEHPNQLVLNWQTFPKRLDKKGFMATIDQGGDKPLRRFDWHVAKDPVAMLKRGLDSRRSLEQLVAGPKRYRGNSREVLWNINRLGLGEYYGSHPKGIAIKQPEVFTKWTNLQDIYQADQIGDPNLIQVDRFAALGKAAEYLRELHEQHGVVGELVSRNFVFKERDGEQVADPVLIPPDVIPNPKIYSPEQLSSATEPQATDVFELMLAIGAEEERRSHHDEASTAKALSAVVEHYTQAAIDPETAKKVIRGVRQFTVGGRGTLHGDEAMLTLPNTITTRFRKAFAQHNQVHLGVDATVAEEVRKQVLIATDKYIHNWGDESETSL